MQYARHVSLAGCILSQLPAAGNLLSSARCDSRESLSLLIDCRFEWCQATATLALLHIRCAASVGPAREWHDRNAAIKTENARVRTVFRSITRSHIFIRAIYSYAETHGEESRRTAVDAIGPANKAERCDFSGSMSVCGLYYIVVIAPRSLVIVLNWQNL
jgi:hypothetical protein